MKTTNYITKGSYDKRLDFLKSKWDALMIIQDTLTSEQLNSDEFQSKKRRIANLYQTTNNEVMREKKDAIRFMLESVSPNRTNRMSKLPTGIITFRNGY